MSDAQIVYATIRPKGDPAPRGDLPPGVFEYGSGATAPVAKFPRVLFGEIAQYDESEDLVEDGYVPVRMYSGRVIGAPLDQIRPVL